jgi:predicted transcriptional regulator
MRDTIHRFVRQEKTFMLGPLLGSESKERVLIFLLARETGYATEMARFFETDLYGIQNQLDRLETGGILVSQKVGRTRVYSFNPGYAFLEELKELLEKTLSFYPEGIREDLLMNRRRPRLRGKPL